MRGGDGGARNVWKTIKEGNVTEMITCCILFGLSAVNNVKTKIFCTN
jgi:hypothetical protein